MLLISFLTSLELCDTIPTESPSGDIPFFMASLWRSSVRISLFEGITLKISLLPPLAPTGTTPLGVFLFTNATEFGLDGLFGRISLPSPNKAL